jgi:8-oxo-dGTP pyrophosphatase MutT (NUDIX family)
MPKKEHPIKNKTSAFILRRKANRPVELLVLSFIAQPFLPWRLPGGGIARGEDPLTALLREVLEETGLESLELRRKLGVMSYFKTDPQAYIHRHDFLLWAPSETPNRWEHRVTGKGNDAGTTFRYHWAAADGLQNLDDEFAQHLTPQYLPELFAPLILK